MKSANIEMATHLFIPFSQEVITMTHVKDQISDQISNAKHILILNFDIHLAMGIQILNCSGFFKKDLHGFLDGPRPDQFNPLDRLDLLPVLLRKEAPFNPNRAASFALPSA